MNTDRELLELAANAAGLPLLHPERDGDRFLSAYNKEWNPLTDDGDALRLVVKLRIDLEVFEASVHATWFEEDMLESHTVIEHCDDAFEGLTAKMVATRRAIVRAAAEMERQAHEPQDR